MNRVEPQTCQRCARVMKHRDDVHSISIGTPKYPDEWGTKILCWDCATYLLSNIETYYDRQCRMMETLNERKDNEDENIM